MVVTKSVRVLAGLFCLLLWPAGTVAQQADWERQLRAGANAYHRGNYAEAVKHAKAALSAAETIELNDWRLATIVSVLARIYRAQGRYAEAEPLYQRSLAIFEKALGPEHTGLAKTLGSLAKLYYRQGKYAKAEPLYQRALAIYEKALGPGHPFVAQSLENYAALLRKTGRATEAAKLEARAQAIRAKRTK
jgi:tetratricopeptide (TPR) repeat protein